MKIRLTLLAALAAVLFVTGCESTGVTTRIQEKSTVFNTLAPWQQRDIKNGIVGVGYSTDMVYIALGKPSKIVTSANGQETVWTYNNYFPPTATYHSQTSLANPGSTNSSRSVESANAPRSTKSLSDTSSKGYAQSQLDVPDLPSDTLYVTFRDGQVYRTKLESESK